MHRGLAGRTDAIRRYIAGVLEEIESEIRSADFHRGWYALFGHYRITL